MTRNTPATVCSLNIADRPGFVDSEKAAVSSLKPFPYAVGFHEKMRPVVA
jgi:hypothetical protein